MGHQLTSLWYSQRKTSPFYGCLLCVRCTYLDFKLILAYPKYYITVMCTCAVNYWCIVWVNMCTVRVNMPLAVSCRLFEFAYFVSPCVFACMCFAFVDCLPDCWAATNAHAQCTRACVNRMVRHQCMLLWERLVPTWSCIQPFLLHGELATGDHSVLCTLVVFSDW